MIDTIAIISNSYTGYQKTLVDYLVSELRARDYKAICVCGHELVGSSESSVNSFVCNSLYPLVDQYDVKGIIVLSGAMAHRFSSANLAQFLDQFSLPLVAIGDSSPDVSMVTTHDQTGMQQLMQHLLTEAEVKRPAFIRGMVGERFTELREEVYRQELDSIGLAIDENHFLCGEYDLDKTYDVVWQFLQDNPDIDALVACNDVMALGAAKAASALGRRIPKDIVISGFDDSDEAVEHLPAITTIRQALDQLAAIGVDTLCDQIDSDEKYVQQIEVGTQLVMRSSTRRNTPLVWQSSIDSFEGFTEALALEFHEIISPDGIEEIDIIIPLWNSLNQGSDEFEKCLQRIKISINKETLRWWSYASHIFDQACQPFLQNPKTRIYAIEVQFCVASIRERIWDLRVNQDFIERRQLIQSSETQRNLSSSTRKRDMLSNLRDWLGANKVRACYAVKYEKPGVRPSERSELLLRWINGQAEYFNLPDYPTEKILPKAHMALQSSDFMLQFPVYSGGKVYGFLYIDPEGVDLTDVDAIANSLGNAMRNRFLLNEVAAQRDKLSTTNKSLERLANLDVLTGLPNRLHAQNYIDKRFKKAKKNDEKLAILFLDLDGFKKVNDTYGHSAGDSLLCDVATQVSAALQNNYEFSSYLARLSGDEFIVVLDNAQSSDAVMPISKLICESISDPFYFDGERAVVSASVGIALYPDHANTSESVLKYADAAMYQAKQSGKSRIVVYGDNNPDPARPDDLDAAA